MRKINYFGLVLLFAFLISVFSCNKSDTTETTTTTVGPNVFNGSISIYSKGNDTTLLRFLNGKYNTIQGSLLLATTDLIDYKKYFGNLQMVKGSVTLYKIPNADLSFLSTVRSVAGNFQVTSCPELTSFSGLTNLDSLVSSIIVERNPKLRNFAGLERILTVSGLTATANPALISFTGLNNLTTLTTS